MTKLSIITINRNNAAGLRKTMESVFAQTCKEFEYIIVDGASTDDSVDVIREISAALNDGNDGMMHFQWISEPDTGIYNAMNKGVKMSSGEYTLMLNSADELVDKHVIERVMPELKSEDMIQGNILVEANGKLIRNRAYGKSNISFFDVLDMRFLHQATFIRRNIVEQYGYYDETNKITSDSYFFITALGFGNATYRYIDLDIVNFDMGGISGTRSQEWQQIGETEQRLWFETHVSRRLMDLYETTAKKVRLYDTLHQNKLIWNIVMVLVYILKFVSPTKIENRQFEEIKK